MVEVYIKNERLDLFKEETISLNQSVKDVSDLSKVFNDYSDSYTVPATPTNNKVFKHYYNIDVFGGFDARIKVDGRIDIGGLTFRDGTFQLTEVSMKGNVPHSYKIRYFSGLTSLKDLFGEDKLSDLTYLDNYNHTYNDETVGTGVFVGLTLNGVTAAITYPLISYDRRFLYSTGSITENEFQTNLEFTGGEGFNWTEIRPAIKVSEVIRSIEQQYDIEFTREFLDRPEIAELYLSLPTERDLTFGDTEIVTFTNVITNSAGALQTRVSYNFTVNSGSVGIPYKVKIYYNDELYVTSQVFTNSTGSRTYNFPSNQPSASDGIIRVAVESQQEITFDNVSVIYQFRVPLTGNVVDEQTFNDTNITTELPTLVIREVISEMSVFNFFDAIKQAFNLVVIPKENNTYYLNDTLSWYSSGSWYDVSQYIEIEKHTVERGDLYKAIKMGFDSNDSLLSNEFRNTFKRQYGAIDEDILIDGQKIDGKILEIKLPFEKPIYERLSDLETGDLTPIQYGLLTDVEQKGIIKPFLFYAKILSIPSNSILFNRFSDSIPLAQYIAPSNSRLVTSESFTMNFEQELNEYTGTMHIDTLYSVYWRDYVNDVMSVNRRKFKYSAMFPQRLLFDLQLNDRLIINEQRYIINSIKTNLQTGKADLTLLNDIFDIPLPSIVGKGILSTNEILAVTDGQQLVITIFGVGEYEASASESWVTFPNAKATANNPFFIDVEENTTGDPREQIVEFTKGSEVLELTVIQL